MEESTNYLDRLIDRAAREFSVVSDYVWKAPRLIEHETKSELEKLSEYYPDNPKLREMRWKLESAKLFDNFPYLIASGNLFSVLSLYEAYLLLLARYLEEVTTVLIKDVRGNGINRFHAYFQLVGMDTKKLPLYEQEQAAVKIRNCLAHASGMLELSRDREYLRQIQTNGSYFSVDDRRRFLERGPDFHKITINHNPKLGSRLSVLNGYPHLLCAYLSKYYASLCEEARGLVQGHES